MSVRKAIGSTDNMDVEYGSVCCICGTYLGDPVGERQLCKKCMKNNEEPDLEQLEPNEGTEIQS